MNIPGGSILSLIKHKALMKQNKVNSSLDKVKTCVVIPSMRSNHIGRLIPFMEDNPSHYGVFTTTPSKLDFSKNDKVQWSHDITGAWTKKLRPTHYLKSKKIISDISLNVPVDLNATQKYMLSMYVCQFFAWLEVWNELLSNCKPDRIITTFECSSSAKALFVSASELEIPSRIHWYGGMRHAMLQSTLSTELWCQTLSDARYYQNKIPSQCKALFMENPERVKLGNDLGIINRDQIHEGPLRFLFLGPGSNPVYTKSMRMADLSVIKSVQNAFGNKIVWRFRPHPGKVQRFHDELSEAEVTSDDFSTRPLNDDLKWAHAIGTATSTLLLDLVKTDRKLFWIQYNLRSISSVDEHLADGIGIHLDYDACVHKLSQIYPHLNET